MHTQTTQWTRSAQRNIVDDQRSIPNHWIFKNGLKNQDVGGTPKKYTNKQMKLNTLPMMPSLPEGWENTDLTRGAPEDNILTA